MFQNPQNPSDEFAQNASKKNLSDELFESSESDRFFSIILHDSKAIFRAAGINSE